MNSLFKALILAAGIASPAAFSYPLLPEFQPVMPGFVMYGWQEIYVMRPMPVVVVTRFLPPPPPRRSFYRPYVSHHYERAPFRRGRTPPVTPEPTTYAMLLGGACLVVLRKRFGRSDV